MIKKKLCFVAGKSGGHIIPCITIAAHHNNQKELDVLFFSNNTPLDKLIITHNPLVTHHVMLSLTSIQRSSFIQVFSIAWKIFSSFCMSFFYLYRHKPEEVITTGGVVAFPVCIAAFLLNIPVTLYSLDAVPGKTIKALIPFSSKIFFCFQSSQNFFPAYKRTLTHYPVRYNKTCTLTQVEALKLINLDPHKKTVLVLGGSQGSLFLNRCIKEWVNSAYFSPSVQIIHQTGALDSTQWINVYKQHAINAHVFSYNPHLESLYNAADIIICRAGAGTLFEIQFFQKPCLVIPLRTQTTTHQVDNAIAISQEYPDLFCWLDQQDIEKNINSFFTTVNTLLNQ